MNTRRQIASGVAAAALALACLAPKTQAQTTITNTFTFTFATGGASTPFNSTWIYWYNSPGGNTPILCDPTHDASNNAASGSLEVISPLAGGTQNVFFGTFASNINNAYDFSVVADTTKYSTISFDILVASNTPLSTAGNYGSIGVGIINTSYGYKQLTAGSVTIPASAATNWYHVSVPIDQTQGLGSVPGIFLDLNSYGGYPLFTMTNWIDNISINGSTAPPPPPPTVSLQKPIGGLNLIDTTPTAQYNRYQVANTNDGSGGLSFVGQSSVTYSWNMTTFPTEDTAYSYQAHFFIVSGSDNTNTVTQYPGPYDQAADYNLANCIFLTIQSDGNGGGAMNLRYKTNEIGGNGMLFNTLSPTNTTNVNKWPIMPICSMDDTNSILGTWSLTFKNTTNITITGPGGMTTNCTLDPASAALFADPATLILGAQPNTAGFTGPPDSQAVIYSSFSLSGTSAAYTDNFVTDTNLNTNIWENLSSDVNGAVLVPPGAAYWIGWTLPAVGYAVVEATNLSGSNIWSSATTLTTIKDGAQNEALLTTNSLPPGKTGYFALVQRIFSQLLVLLPGETNAPGTATGKIGTPAPFSLSANNNILTFSVLAVDSHWFPVPGITDSLSFSDTDGGIYQTNPKLTNGAAQLQVFYQNTASNVVITASDTTTTTIKTNSSTPFTVGP